MIKEHDRYAREYYDDLLRSLPEEYTFYRWRSSPAAMLDYRETRRAILRALKGNGGRRMLEVGCGDGTWTELLAERADSLRCIEQSEEMITRAKERLKRFPDIVYVNENFPTSIPQELCDTAVSVRAFEYFGDKTLAAAGFARSLKPGGTLVLVTKNALRYRKDIARGTEKLHAIEIDRRETVRILRAAGFEIVRVYPAIIKWRPELFLPRTVFDGLQWLCVFASRFLRIVDPLPRFTESYLYIARKM